MELKAIDVSAYNGLPDWDKVAYDGIKAAILRVHEKYGTDSSFEHNFTGCKNNGIAIGVYKYSYALTTEQAEQEADAVLEALNGRGLDFPVFYDLEWEVQEQLSGDLIGKISNAFLNKIKQAGYKVGIYCNTNWYDNILDRSILPYDFWLASVPSNDTGEIVERLRPSDGVGWQYSWKGTVDGINGVVDCNVFYTDYRGDGEMGTIKNVIDLVKSREEKNQYTQSELREQVFDGYSDCSSLMWKCFQKAAGIFIGTWTGEQIDKGTLIYKNTSDSHVLTAEMQKKIFPGDLVFWGPSRDDSRHVEMYIGNNQLIGHGSGIGPRIKTADQYNHTYKLLEVRRYMDVAGVQADTTEQPETTDTSKTTIAYPARMKADTKCYLEPGGAQSTLFPVIKKEALVDVMKHTSTDASGNKYYFIRIPHATEGFIFEYIKAGSFQHLK